MSMGSYSDGNMAPTDSFDVAYTQQSNRKPKKCNAFAVSPSLLDLTMFYIAVLISLILKHNFA